MYYHQSSHTSATVDMCSGSCLCLVGCWRAFVKVKRVFRDVQLPVFFSTMPDMLCRGFGLRRVEWVATNELLYCTRVTAVA